MRRSKLLVFSLVLTLLLTMSLGNIVRADEAAVPSTKTITIIHTNDTHSRVLPDAGIGFAKIATLVKEYRAKNPNTLVIDAGDTFHGQTFATVEQGESIVRVMNAVGYDVMTPGNHDFNYGYERLLQLSKLTNFPIISANVTHADGSHLLTPYIIKEMDGIKVGIFGLSTPETTYKTNPKNVEGLTFADPVAAAQATVNELQSKADLIIAVTHLGIDATSVDTSEKVANAVSGIDVIIDGHSHSVLAEGKLVGKTLIASAGEYDNNLGVVQLTFNGTQLMDKQARLISKKDAESTTPDADVENIIKATTTSQDSILLQVIGATSVKLEGAREQVRKSETNLGNLITDAMINMTGADIALTNGGGIRDSIAAGDITKKQVITVLPFGNYIVTKKVKGADIKAALEHGVEGYPGLVGAFPHVSGISYAIDPGQPAGKRVVSVLFKGQPLNMDKEYLLATNDFMAVGGDGYTMFKGYPVANEFPALDEALTAYIQQQKAMVPRVEGRIVELAAANHWAGQLAIGALNAGVLQAPTLSDGVTRANRIDLDAQITRGEFSGMLNRSLGLPEATLADATTPLTREMGIQMVVNDYLKLSGPATAIPGNFSDASSVGDSYKASMATGVRVGLVAGYNGLLTPQAPLTRADALALLYKMLYILSQSAQAAA